jgi:hypothetical protein
MDDCLVPLSPNPGNVFEVESRRLAQDELFCRLDQHGQGLPAAERQSRDSIHERQRETPVRMAP